MIEQTPHQLSYPIGNCHGDLTLSNLIVDPINGITLIDFLYTYLESPLQDIAKLSQEFVYGWSFRSEAETVRIKSKIMCQYMKPKIIEWAEKRYPEQDLLLTLLGLAGIAPYVRDAQTKNWVISSIRKCIASSRLSDRSLDKFLDSSDEFAFS